MSCRPNDPSRVEKQMRFGSLNGIAMLEIGKSMSSDSGANTVTATPFCRSNFRIDESYEPVYTAFPSAGKTKEFIDLAWIFRAVMDGSRGAGSSSSSPFSSALTSGPA